MTNDTKTITYPFLQNMEEMLGPLDSIKLSVSTGKLINAVAELPPRSLIVHVQFSDLQTDKPLKDEHGNLYCILWRYKAWLAHYAVQEKKKHISTLRRVGGNKQTEAINVIERLMKVRFRMPEKMARQTAIMLMKQGGHDGLRALGLKIEELTPEEREALGEVTYL